MTYQILTVLTRIAPETLYMACGQRFAATITPPDYASPSIQLASGKTVPISPFPILHEQTRPETAVQFCPLYLQEAAYHRVAWLPLAVTVCLQHQC